MKDSHIHGSDGCVAVLIDGVWGVAMLVEKRAYKEPWRRDSHSYLVEREGRHYRLESWEVRERSSSERERRDTVRVPRPQPVEVPGRERG